MNNSDYFWWKKENGNDRAAAIFDYVKSLDNKQGYIADGNYKNMRLYGNLEPFALRGYAAYRSEPSGVMQPRVTLNVVQSMIDTVVSKITKNKPKPTFLTDGGDFTLQRKAKKLTQFIEGQFHATNFYQLKTQSFKESCIEGTGAIKIYRDGAEICAEKVLVDELVVDDGEAIYGCPRQLHQKKYINVEVLKAAYPKYEIEIDNASNSDPSQFASNSFDRASNMLLVIESWHLPSKKGAKDGLHTISINNKTLFEEDYARDYFPFVFDRWCTRPLGFWGQGIAEQLTGLQLEINKILRTIQISMHLVSVPKLLVEASSKIVSAHLNNKIGGIIKYTGIKPDFGSLGTIPPELFAHLDRLYTRAFEIVGISQLSAQSLKPAGLDSGKALREYSDIESERFLEVGERYQQSFLDASKIFIDLIKEIAEETGEYKLKIKGKKFLETVDWKDVSMEEDMYMMQVFPSSALSSTPAARLQDVQELLQAGFISKEDGMKLLDFPDLQQYYNFNNSGVEDIERAIELIIDKGDYQTPEPYQNLEMGIVKMQQAYLYYRTMNAPESLWLELFRRWIEDAGMLLKKAAESASAEAAISEPMAGPAQPMPPEASPIAIPEAPPTSDILPVA